MCTDGNWKHGNYDLTIIILWNNHYNLNFNVVKMTIMHKFSTRALEYMGILQESIPIMRQCNKFHPSFTYKILVYNSQDFHPESFTCTSSSAENYF